ncbi:MAG: PD-(D/E)XK nuclease family protein [Spirochaetaceae bacterium]|jgi:CRISPR/Cas system-associated exonuclease Cas4 (RecB family)|nr:PD-(D/E)XK nuclease family protein [Spirochaetaceae bacterium]
MNRPVLDYIIEALPDRDTRFVFPSAVSAQFWAWTAAVESRGPLGTDRFIAWDIFKAETLSVRREDRRAVNRAARTFFSFNLLRENSRGVQNNHPLLADYINPRYADACEAFIPSLVRLLPALNRIMKPLEHAGTGPYFGDLRLIRARYDRFLEEYRLYEPSWDRAPFASSGLRWILFFPELAEDWEEYAGELTERAAERDSPLRIVRLDRIAPPRVPELKAGALPAVRRILPDYAERLIRFPSSREEYRWLALTVRRLLDEAGLGPEDMAISFPGLGDNHERLVLEFRLRDMTVDIRRGKALPEHPGGRIFAALAACPAGRWSFRALKDLLLDQAFPWKNRAVIDAFLEFGLRYRCVSGFTENGREVDVWERSFDRIRDSDEPVHLPIAAIKKFYRQLKRDIRNLNAAKTFSGLRKQWLIFEANHFDRARINPRTDQILARAMEALEELIETEEGLTGSGNSPGILPGEDPEGRPFGRVFPVFQSYIKDIEYVYQSGAGGIPVYDYRVAAGIAPLAHFIINMNQEEATVLCGGVPLREDRRDILNLRERDITPEFIGAYARSGVFPVFTASDRTFRGSAIPHRMLEELLPNPPLKAETLRPLPDPYALEEDLVRSIVPKIPVPEGGPPEPGFPETPSSLQKQGWEARRVLTAPPPRRDIRKAAIGDSALRSALTERLSGKDGEYRISPTDLNAFLSCPFKWLLQKGLGIREKQTEIETIDQRELGILYHRILERFFTRLKGKGPFLTTELPAYKIWLMEEVESALSEARSGEGAFQESVYEMLRERIAAALTDYLDADAETLEGCEVLGAEFPLRKNYSPAGPALSGIADLVLREPGGGLVLTDYKTAVLPGIPELIAGEDIPANIQMAAYIRMVEADGSRVTRARFYSIDNREFREVVAPEGSQKRLPKSREEYETEVAATDRIFAGIAAAMETGFYPAPQDRSRCVSCMVSPVCRAPFLGGEP